MSDVLRGQKKRLLEYLQKHGTIDPLEAWMRLSIYRLSDVIMRLREDYDIRTDMIPFTNEYGEKGRYGRYVYVGEKNPD